MLMISRIAIMKSKTNYVQALVSFQEYSFNAGQYTSSFFQAQAIAC